MSTTRRWLQGCQGHKSVPDALGRRELAHLSFPELDAKRLCLCFNRGCFPAFLTLAGLHSGYLSPDVKKLVTFGVKKYF